MLRLALAVLSAIAATSAFAGTSYADIPSPVFPFQQTGALRTKPVVVAIKVVRDDGAVRQFSMSLAEGSVGASAMTTETDYPRQVPLDGAPTVQNGKDTVVTGATYTLRAHRATEGVIAVHLAFSDNELTGFRTEPASGAQVPVVETHAEESGRWISLREGEETTLAISRDQLKIRAF